jgi:putative ABC transport system permease protein
MPISLTDFRNAARGLRRTPVVTLCAVLCLALGLGGTTAIASAIDRALVRTVPFRDPGRLLSVYRVVTPLGNDFPFSAPKYLDLVHGARREELAAASFTSSLISLPDQGVRATTARVTGNLFPLLGARAAHGRLIEPADDSAGQNAVVVVSDELWRRSFGADPGIVGRSIIVDAAPATVIGILPRGFHVPIENIEVAADVWLPMRFTAEERAQRGNHFLSVAGRLNPGATVAGADLELRTLVTQLAQTYPEMHGESARAVLLQSDNVRSVRTPLLLTLGAVCAVLLIASANVGSLLLARGVYRQRELAVRAALGASRWAIVRPVIAECLLLTSAGGILGIGLAWLAVRGIGALAAEQIPQLTGLSIEIRIVAFALTLSGVVALLCGALPAWYGASVDPQDALRGGNRGGASRTQQRTLGALVVAEVALSLTLLIGASLVLRGFSALVGRDPGFDPRPVLALSVNLSPGRYRDTSAVPRFLRPALTALEQLPGVQSAGAISQLPYRDNISNFNIRYEGQANIDPGRMPLANDRHVAPGFFQVVQQRVLAGRLLRWDDDNRPGVPLVAVVNEALVRRDFPQQDPIGKRFYVTDTMLATIVGVVSDIPNAGPASPPLPEADWSYAQGAARGDLAFNIVVRAARGDPAALESRVRDAIHSTDPSAAISDVQPMTRLIAASVGAPKFYVSLIGTFALVAVVLAVAGLYGVMSYAVAQLTREVGIRTALGSSTSQILQMVTGRGMKLVGTGVGVGVIGAAVATRGIASLLYGVSPADAPTWVLAIIALSMAGLVASVIPAFRAARVDPIIAIRAD